MKIFDVEITDVEAHRNNPPEHQAAIFAHLNPKDKKEAVKQLQEALNPKQDKPKADSGAGAAQATPIKAAAVKLAAQDK
jgi:hypothetical protein